MDRRNFQLQSIRLLFRDSVSKTKVKEKWISINSENNSFLCEREDWESDIESCEAKESSHLLLAIISGGKQN